MLSQSPVWSLKLQVFESKLPAWIVKDKSLPLTVPYVYPILRSVVASEVLELKDADIVEIIKKIKNRIIKIIPTTIDATM